MPPKKTSSRSLRYATTQDMPEGMRRLVQLVKTSAAAAPAPAEPRAYRPPAAAQASNSGNAAGKVARGRVRHQIGEMNKTEQCYADWLQAMRQRGEILWFGFECWTFKLAKDTRYTPDFVVQLPNGELLLVEVKGRAKGGKYFAEDDAKVKVKVAAAAFPMLRIKIVWPDGNGGWDEEHIGWKEPNHDR